MSFIDQIRQIIGSAPEGYEALEYIVASILLCFLIGCCFRLINSIFHIGR